MVPPFLVQLGELFEFRLKIVHGLAGLLFAGRIELEVGRVEAAHDHGCLLEARSLSRARAGEDPDFERHYVPVVSGLVVLFGCTQTPVKMLMRYLPAKSLPLSGSNGRLPATHCVMKITRLFLNPSPSPIRLFLSPSNQRPAGYWQ